MMKISSSSYLFAQSVSSSFKNTAYAAAKNPIGIEIDPKTIDEKIGKLKSLLTGVDLRNITPRELGLLGTKLYAAGEISDISVGSFVVGNGDLDARDTKFDAIEYFEKSMKLVRSDRDLARSIPLYEDTLNTFYNLDKLIRYSHGETIDVFI